MSLAEMQTAAEYDDASARKILAKAIKAHQAKIAELAELRAAIGRAATKLAGLKEEIDRTAHVEQEMVEATALALARGVDVLERSHAWKRRERRDALVAELEVLQPGFAHLQAKAGAHEKAVDAAHMAVIEAREPIAQAGLDKLAGELLTAETVGARLRARLYGFSVCSQKLPWLARSLLSSPPKNAALPQTNSPAARLVDEEKQAFKDWKRALETDANAQLTLEAQ
jgi:hypothetical protein